VKLSLWPCAWATAIFATTAIAIFSGLARATDLHVLDAMRVRGESGQVVGASFLTNTILSLNALAAPPVMGFLSVLAALGLALCREWRRAILVIVGPVGALAIAQALKHGFARSRPPNVYWMVEAHGASFPSVHTIVATATVLTLALTVLDRRSLRVPILTLAIVTVGVIGLCRAYLGVHWLSDVIAAWSAGVAWSWACARTILWSRASSHT
jgi:undecaprenyl-diphosphatase